MASGLKDKTIEELLTWHNIVKEIVRRFNVTPQQNDKFLKYNGLLNQINTEIEKRINEEFF